MSTYFEALVNSMDEEYRNDFLMMVCDILKKALKFSADSNRYFEMSTEGDPDDMYWGWSMEYDKRARGLLDAYEILVPGRKVYTFRSSIEGELDWLDETFEIDWRG